MTKQEALVLLEQSIGDLGIAEMHTNPKETIQKSRQKLIYVRDFILKTDF